jgi:ribonuclease P protein component
MAALAVPAASATARLRSGADIRAVFASRRTAHGRAAVVHLAARPDDAPARWTVVAGRKVGDAVRRNRAKRRLRAVLGELALPAGTDLVVVARAGSQELGHAELRTEVARLIAKALERPERA